MELETLCPAKINLFLEVLGKRPDSYHEIRTLFQRLDSGDILKAKPATQISLKGADKLGIAPSENLVVRAAQILKEHGGVKEGVEFHLEKKLPAGGGLGGGSSDAAGALRLCNELWGLNYSSIELQKLAAPLGADIPFFLGSPTALGTGTGTQLVDLPPPLSFWVLITTPHSFVPTGPAYSWLNAKTLSDGSQTGTFSLEEIQKGLKSPGFYPRCFNDFHGPVLSHFPDIFLLDEKIREFSPSLCLLSGSGASLFSLFEEKTTAQSCLKEVEKLCRFSTICSWEQKTE